MNSLPQDWIARAQRELGQRDLRGWLLYDFRGLNPIARRFLGLSGHASRRIYLFVPASGAATLLTHMIEAGSLPKLPDGVQHANESLSSMGGS
jgi:hypothetical protein